MSSSLTTKTDPQTQIQLTDRQLKLRNYHARKVLERQQLHKQGQQGKEEKEQNGQLQQGQQQKRGVEQQEGQLQHRSGMEERKQEQKQQKEQPGEQRKEIHASQQRSILGEHISRQPNLINEKSHLYLQQQQQSQQYLQQGPRQRSLLGESSSQTTTKVQHLLSTPLHTVSSKSSNSSTSSFHPSTKGASSSQVAPSESSTVTSISQQQASPTVYISPKIISPVVSLQILEQGKTMSSHQKAAFLASLRGSNVGSITGGISIGVGGNAGSIEDRRVSEGSGVTGRGDGEVSNEENRGDNENNNQYDTPTAAPRANSSIGLPALDNRDKMKRMFAARRRKAQIEMSVGGNTSSGGAIVSGCGGSGSDSAGNSRESTNSIQSLNSIGSSKSSSTLSSHSLSHRSSSSSNSGGGIGIGSESGNADSTGNDSSSKSRNSDVRKGRTQLPSVKEESSHSLSSAATATTSHTTNAPLKSFAERSTTNSAIGTVGILRESSSTVRENILNSDTVYGSSSSNSSNKMVRFHLPPKEEKLRNSQCSPPRTRMVSNTRAEEEAGGEVVARQIGKDSLLGRDVVGSIADDDEDMEFVLFVAGLKREVAGDHMEVSVICIAFQYLCEIILLD